MRGLTTSDGWQIAGLSGQRLLCQPCERGRLHPVRIQTHLSARFDRSLQEARQLTHQRGVVDAATAQTRSVLGAWRRRRRLPW